MKKKVSNYSDIVEKHKNQLLADGKSEADIAKIKRKKPQYWYGRK